MQTAPAANQKVVAPWRRNEAIKSAIDHECTSSSSKTTFSAQAPEFVPRFNATAAEFVPSFNPQVAAFVPSFMIAGDTQPTPQSINSGCFSICLDDYSDYSDSDSDIAVQPAAVAQEPQCHAGDTNKLPKFANEYPATATVPAVEQLDGEDQNDMLSPTSSTGTISTQAGTKTSSPSSSSSTDISDVEPESAGEDDENRENKETSDKPSFTINGLLKLRHAVSLLDGIEDRLSATEVSPRPSDKAVTEAKSPERKSPVSKPVPPPEKPRQIKSTSEKVGPWRDTGPRAQTCSGNDFAAVRKEASESVKLKVSEDSWLVRQNLRRNHKEGSQPDTMTNEEVSRAVNCILNKLTIENFPRLSKQLVQCGIRTTSHLEILIHEVFEKATTQHHFIDMYADLCTFLHEHFSGSPVSDDPKMNFKKVLLNACQASFETHLAPPVSLDRLEEEDRVFAEQRYKMRMLGNIRFVGTLLVRKMLANKVMFAIMEELLSDPTPEALESLASLLSVVCPTFDFPEWPHRLLLVAVFDRVKQLTKQPNLKSRVRCLLQDVLDLRAAGWQDRKPKKMEAPSTIDEVHKKAAAEEAAANTQADGWMNTRRPINGYGTGKTWSPSSQSFVSKTLPSHGNSGNSGSIKDFRGSTATLDKSNIKGLAADLFATGHSEKPSSPQTSYLADLTERLVRPTEQLKKRREKPCEERFDPQACRKEVSNALTELRLSHDVKEAVLRIAGIAVPLAHQSEELCEVLTMIAEEGSAEVRKIGFQFVVGLFTEGHWKPGALGKGIQNFMEGTCANLKSDVPALPKIVREELHPCFAPLAKTGLLQPENYSLLMAEF